ncbi:LysE family transporter [Vibrio parahaemolyticus]|nr:LysE family transporter [Vibrio parahaemolyticus]ELA9314725.1 LysE family transporter [Vibrio parahaemolyticus]ELA9432703.1 LysE family transporter [Vibrio parahaemolyticus]
MEFVTLALLGVLVVISPGTDFVLVLRNSLNQGREAGVYSAIGISMAISIHIAYSMLGISYLISQNEWLFNLVRYLGIKGIFSSQPASNSETIQQSEYSMWHFFMQGFLCNLLNPKTMLFFLSIFSQVISPDSSQQHIALFYGIYMIALHGIWVSIVAVLFTSPQLQAFLLKIKHRLNQVCGAGLVIFGAMLGLKA